MKSHTDCRGPRPAARSLRSPRSTKGGRRAAAHGSRWRAAGLGLVIVSTLALGACRQDMHNQPKYKPLRGTAFFADGASARPLLEGTVARGTLQENDAFFTGKTGTALVRELPFKVDEAAVSRGQERYNIFCAPCHDATGTGRGMVVQRGYKQPPSFHEDRLRNIEAGYFFDVMTNGFGSMPDYRAQLSARDRWNVVAYIRALQLSQGAPAADVPGGDPLKAGQAAAPAAPQGPAKH
jgi:mono/diheme cytochrome c family protein